MNSEGNQPSHHSYMLLIILLILSQDECFNKSIHEKVCIHVLTITIINYYHLLQCKCNTTYHISVHDNCWEMFRHKTICYKFDLEMSIFKPFDHACMHADMGH